MSDTVQPGRRSFRPQVKKQVSTFVSSRRSKMFGLAEIVGLTLSCLVLLLVIFSYFYFLLPHRAFPASIFLLTVQSFHLPEWQLWVLIRTQNH